MPSTSSFLGRMPDPLLRPRGGPPVLLRALATGLIAVALFGASAAAQAVIGGSVIDSTTRAPIPGVQVTVQNTTLGALTDATGHFRISGVRGEQATLIARRIGYASSTKTVAAGDSTVSFVLEPRSMSLDVVVVTGTAGGQTKREIGNAITTIDAAQVTKIAPVTDFQQLLNGRAPNVTVMPGSGEIGTGAKIRVRGTSSLSLSQTPLIYVDGVRMDNSQATGPANQAFGSSSISRWNDIDPEDIERIEVLKGPSAATLYGTEAANGVIQIITKQGAAGPTRYSFTMTQGTNFIMNPQGRWPTNYNIVNGQIQSLNYTQLNDLYKQHTGQNIFQNGHDQKYHVGVSGGTDRFQYYVSGVREENDGVEPTNNLSRTGARANLNIQPSDKFRVQAHLGYITGRTNLAPEAGYGGRVWTTELMDPANLSDPAEYGFHSGLPYQYDQIYHMYQDINRFTGSVQITNTPVSWFTHRLIIGADQVNSMDVEAAARVDSLVSTSAGSDALGYKYQTNNTNGFRTFDYAATARFNATPSINLATSVGGQYYTKRYEGVSAGGSVFAFEGLTSINSLTQGLSSGQDVLENRTLGFYAQEQIGWKDRRYLTLALRSDKNSAFGQQFSRAYYPKASVSWVLSDEPFFHVGFVNSLRLRAAYGESGEQPNQFDALRTYLPATGPGDQPAVVANTIGNANLGPERSKELEMGFESSFLRDRLGLEFTYYDKRTSQAILDAQFAPSVGFGTDRFVNAGQVSNKGVELLARVTPVQNNTVTWDASFAFSYNKNNIINLGVPGLSYLTPGSYQRDEAGYPVGAWFEKKVVSAQLDSAGNAYDIMCADGNGGSVDCKTAPAVYLGNSIPDKQGAFTSTVTLWNRLKVYGMMDFQLGQQKLDGNLRIRCYFQIGGVCREKVYPQDYSPVLEAGIQKRYPGYLITNSGFAKLREVSVSYSLPETVAGRVGASAASITLAGHNLHTWTKYKGLEPEADFLGGSRGTGNVAWEQTVTPQLSSFLLTLNLTF